MTKAPDICVAGAGAIGGLLAALLAQAGASVSLVARGDTLRRIAANGLTLDDGTARRTFRLAAATTAPGTVQDLVVLAGKSHQLPALAQTVRHALGPETIVLPVVNGLPWWLAERPDGIFAATRDLLDPDGGLARIFPATAVVGCVAYAFASTPQPGVVRTTRTPMLILGEPDGTVASPRVLRLAGWLRKAGLDAVTDRALLGELWAKLAANAASNPLSVVTGADLQSLATDPDLRDIVTVLLGEAIAVGEACGIAPVKTVTQHLATMAAAGPHMTSMRQDLEAGRELELAAIGEALLRLGRAHGVATPGLLTVLRLAARLSRATPAEPHALTLRGSV